MHACDKPRRRYTGKPFDSRGQRPQEGLTLLTVVPRPGYRHRHQSCVLIAEARVNLLGGLQAANEEPRRNEKDHGQGHLAHYQHVLERETSRAPATGPFILERGS